MLVSRVLNIFAVRDYRWLWSNNSLQVFGMSMELLALGWLVLLMTDSPLWVGVASGLRGMGHVGFGLFGGVIADRMNRRNVLGLLQLLRGLILTVLGVLVLTDKAELWQILAVAPLLGVADAIAAPALQSLIYDTVGPGRLLNAMAAMLAGFHLSWVAGSVVAGTVINTAGVGVGFLVAAGANFASPALLLRVHSGQPVHHPWEPVWRSLLDGLKYASTNRQIRALLLLSVLVETFGFAYIFMLPVVARDVLQVGASGLGYLSAAGSVGALAGTIVVGGLGEVRGKWSMLATASGGAGVALLLFAVSPWFATSLVLAGAIGLALVVYDATIATLLQLVSAEALRGRILGMYGLTWGFTPLGGFIAGAVASVLNAPVAIGVGGVVIVSYTIGVLARMGGTERELESSTSGHENEQRG